MIAYYQTKKVRLFLAISTLNQPDTKLQIRNLQKKPLPPLSSQKKRKTTMKNMKANQREVQEDREKRNLL